MTFPLHVIHEPISKRFVSKLTKYIKLFKNNNGNTGAIGETSLKVANKTPE